MAPPPLSALPQGEENISLWAKLQEGCEIAPELTGHGLPLSKCEAYNRVYEQF
jgi:hypothetical protein